MTVTRSQRHVRMADMQFPGIGTARPGHPAGRLGILARPFRRPAGAMHDHLTVGREPATLPVRSHLAVVRTCVRTARATVSRRTEAAMTAAAVSRDRPGGAPAAADLEPGRPLAGCGLRATGGRRWQ